MNVDAINTHLSRGEIDAPGLFPHVEDLARMPFVFRVDFGLQELPDEPGILVIRGARQYGKSTWLEQQILATVERFGPGTAYYVNGDELATVEVLMEALRRVVPLYRRGAPVRRLFIDEVTAVKGWERGLKRLLDAGELRDVLVVTTGSQASDLRRGSERLPGRRGRLERSSYLFTPISFAEFQRVCGAALKEDTLTAYLLSGGCPAACSELGATGRLPEYVTGMIRDWIYGECSASGRDRASLLAVLEVVLERGGTPIGQSRLARESGLANNTVAAGYVGLLADLMCLGVSHAWDPAKRVSLRRKRAKYPLINLLAAVAWDRSHMRSPSDFGRLTAADQGRWLEWLVAQELWRRAAISGEEFPEYLNYWQGGDRELDFVVSPALFVEVKRGRTSPVEYAWFARRFRGARLVVIGRDTFETETVRGVTLEQFLLESLT